ncbi:uncharacterized protein LOC129909466 [Episyrphus balteatus]|uniref:uncharacterized protein LOC129909466 n=1 Tax=Episyrphus balteatus TaxID=286459 RepID=UPI002485C601|nr:uncharacterized protein LOC129909466 [Episyrphus balteatus]
MAPISDSCDGNRGLSQQDSTHDRDVTAVRLQTDQGTIWIASAYLGHDHLGPLPCDKLRRLIADGERQKICLMIGCDANAHHTVWGSTDINDRESNTGNEPTFVTRKTTRSTRHYSCLQFDSSKDIELESIIDHRYIQFSINDVTTKQLAFRNYRKTNWQKYRETLKSLLKPEFLSYPSNTIDLDNKVNDLTSALNLSMNNSCQLIQVRGKQKPHWWNSGLEPHRKGCRKLFNLAKSTRDVQTGTHTKNP